ncbi:MAG: phosphoribosylaminoimidazolesuccinocarboxamide synthase [Kutzneria sp.]|nr:phosphoribosylaminoimidazolesuccinocarboxamide synthase [Kutzneria sp.]MBV9845979.1 phosphoribosylaminoimidazolesuccinocarboxamide synthase [Kutzneria sp.]
MPELADYRQVAAGKVRQLYAVDERHLLLVASDRISAYDWVLPTEIPDKGAILTAMSVFWFDQLDDVVPNHVVTSDDDRIPAEVSGRALLVRRLTMLPVECVARGYLTGSGLADYRRTGSVCGVSLPAGLDESAQLDQPIFTPATKAPIGGHDENVSFAAVADRVGDELAERLRELTLRVYSAGARLAERSGLILADTKLEFGVDEAGELVLGDELLTPDSSRYWPSASYQRGRVQPSYDKQYVRDWLTSPDSGWDRGSGAPPPPLPDDVVAATRARYVEAYERITGLRFES